MTRTDRETLLSRDKQEQSDKRNRQSCLQSCLFRVSESKGIDYFEHATEIYCRGVVKIGLTLELLLIVNDWVVQAQAWLLCGALQALCHIFV
jgi:hypothetical protein